VVHSFCVNIVESGVKKSLEDDHFRTFVLKEEQMLLQTIIY
jgi:hypothetical protein